ncbi:MAG: nuclear transport factor 2 family protein [Gemmatimonadota bacterium]|nr:MAG: nuclear transport factor 2 family protein [Gemmatimonadota bacterium]
MAKRFAFLLALLPVLPGVLQAQSPADSAAITQTALDYIEGWYEGNAERMERALHPELAKRMVSTDPASGASRLNHMTAEQLVAGTRAGYGTQTPEAERRRDVTILDIYESVACVKVVAKDWVDYLHVVEFDNRWVIINVLWELTPEAKQQMGGR